MLKALFLLMRKDATALVLRGGGPLQPLLLGVLVIFLLSSSVDTGSLLASSLASAIFWLASIFFIILFMPTLYALEETNLARHALISLGFPLRLIWLAKCGMMLIVLLLAQLIFLLAIYIFLDQVPVYACTHTLLSLFAANFALSALAALFAPIAQLQKGGQTLLALIFLPLSLGLFLRLMDIAKAAFTSANINISLLAPHTCPTWLDQHFDDMLFVLAFAFIFTGLSILLFPLIYREN